MRGIPFEDVVFDSDREDLCADGCPVGVLPEPHQRQEEHLLKPGADGEARVLRGASRCIRRRFWLLDRSFLSFAFFASCQGKCFTTGRIHMNVCPVGTH